MINASSNSNSSNPFGTNDMFSGRPVTPSSAPSPVTPPMPSMSGDGNYNSTVNDGSDFASANTAPEISQVPRFDDNPVVNNSGASDNSGNNSGLGNPPAPKKSKFSPKVLLASAVLFLLAVGTLTAVYMTQFGSGDVRQQASSGACDVSTRLACDVTPGCEWVTAPPQDCSNIPVSYCGTYPYESCTVTNTNSCNGLPENVCEATNNCTPTYDSSCQNGKKCTGETSVGLCQFHDGKEACLSDSQCRWIATTEKCEGIKNVSCEQFPYPACADMSGCKAVDCTRYQGCEGSGSSSCTGTYALGTCVPEGGGGGGGGGSTPTPTPTPTPTSDPGCYGCNTATVGEGTFCQWWPQCPTNNLSCDQCGGTPPGGGGGGGGDTNPPANVCMTSPKGITVVANTGTGWGAGNSTYGHKIISIDPNDASRYYDASAGEQVILNVDIINNTANPISDLYHYTAQKVIQSPTNTYVDENTAIDEPTLGQNKVSGNDVQEPRFNSGNKILDINPGQRMTLTGTMSLRECGIYQIDIGVEDFANRTDPQCNSGSRVVGAGFVRVKNCASYACNSSCTSDVQCGGAGAGISCIALESGWTDWQNTTFAVEVGSGTITGFSAYVDNGNWKQYAVRNGRLWVRSNPGSGWGAWTDSTNAITGTTITSLSSFSTYTQPNGNLKQHAVGNGKLFTRERAGGIWTSWSDTTGAVANAGTGTLTGFDAYVMENGIIKQYAVKNGQLWVRTKEASGWTGWAGPNQAASTADPGVLTHFAGFINTDGIVRQYAVVAGKLFSRDNANKRCRLTANPTSETCQPATTPTPTPPPPAPMCLSINMSKPNPVIGDSVTFTCGKVSGASSYDFRIRTPDGKITNLSSTNQVSSPFKVTMPGKHVAQCRICVTTGGATACQEWEPLPGILVPTQPNSKDDPGDSSDSDTGSRSSSLEDAR